MAEEELVCPNCGDGDNLHTVETIQGLANAVFTLTPGGTRETEYGGETDVLWDTSTTIGIHCRSCDWEAMEVHDDGTSLAGAIDAIDQLVTKAEYEASKRPPKFASQEEADAWLEAHSS